MSLYVASNSAAETAHRWMKSNDTSMAKSIERLSSGFRINSAADDAAGLVLSEGMRTNLSGLNVAEKNTQDGINMFKTGENALDEIETQLRNIRDLTLHAANNKDNVSAKSADQAQVEQALASINRIADQTEFEGMKLFSGTSTSDSINGKSFQIGANSTQSVAFDLTGKAFDGVALTTNMHTTSILGGSSTTNSTLAKATGAAAYATGGNDSFGITWTKADGTTFSTSLSTVATGATVDVEVTNINTALAGKSYTTAADPSVTNLGDVIEAYRSTANGTQDDAAGTFISFRLKDVDANAGEKTSSSKLAITSSNSGAIAQGARFGVPGTSGVGGVLATVSSRNDYVFSTSTATESYGITMTHADGTTQNFATSISYDPATDTTVDDVVAKLNTALGTTAYSHTGDAGANLDDVMEAFNDNGKVGFRMLDVADNQDEKTGATTLTITSGSDDAGTGSLFGAQGVSGGGGSLAAGSIDLTNSTTQSQFDAIVNSLDKALKAVNGLRVNLGAFQKNNLESNLSSIGVAKENLSASESSIRNTDMASEMVNFTKSQILVQAAQSMMTQANQQPQNILQMLR